MHLGNSARLHELERVVDALPEPRLAPRQSRETHFARGPIAGRRVELHDRHLRGLERTADGLCIEIVRKQQLDPLEARGLRGRDALERWQLREQEPDVGGEFQGAAILAAAWLGRTRTYASRPLEKRARAPATR